MAGSRIEAVVFDLGNVLIPWNPRFLYRKLFGGDEAKMDWFLANVCTFAWNETFDSGRSFAEGVSELIAQFPQYADMIRAYDSRWEEMLGDPIEENVALLQDLKRAGHPVYALSNWPAGKFQIARRRCPFLSLFDGMVISGEVGFKKPSPEIFQLLLSKHKLDPGRCVFIDDTSGHVAAARSLGLNGIVYQSPVQLRQDLGRLGLP